MGPFEMVVLIVLIGAIASIVKSALGKGHARQRSRKSAAKSADHDYTAWQEGQKASERQTKEIELFKLKKAEREEARKTYERLALEKLDVMKTAISMGMEKDDLADLDTRLEKLIGQDRLERLLDEEVAVPEVSVDLMDADLESEINRLQNSRHRDQRA